MISLMGVFGLVMFDAEHRRKEIGIRRVNGAGIGDILAMFNMKFIKIVLVCFAIAAPLSYFVTDAYLKGIRLQNACVLVGFRTCPRSRPGSYMHRGDFAEPVRCPGRPCRCAQERITVLNRRRLNQ